MNRPWYLWDDPDDCPALQAELDTFVEDPITIAYGVGDGEFCDLIRSSHRKKCLLCQGMEDPHTRLPVVD